MNRVKVDLGSRSYDILIDAGLLDEVGKLANELVGTETRIMLVTNSTVYNLYSSRVEKSMSGRKHQPIVAMVPDGEEFKTIAQVEKILDLAIDHHLDRTSMIIALGGGVIGDMAGFAAAIYQRGINLMQIPTTLLAQVDSSVGGKVAVNHPRGKNMIGAFYQPRMVVIDIEVLRTLSPRDYYSGLVEVLKYGIIFDSKFFDYLERNAEAIHRQEPECLNYIIQRSCEIKAEIVEADEREDGRRAILNLGHTFGHALETCAGYGYLRHGEAVALGIELAGRLAVMLGLLNPFNYSRILEVMERLHLRFKRPSIPASRLIDAMHQDKKIREGVLRLVLPVDIGQVMIVQGVDEMVIEAALDGF